MRSKRQVSIPTPTQGLVVQHSYHDHANEILHGTETSPHNMSAFLRRLYDLLDGAEAEGIEHVISWQPHGRCFVLREPKILPAILSKFFNVSKVSSFQRQLNLYGFLRITRGLDKGGYYHEYFLRGRPSLANQITRVKIKGTKVRQKSNPSEEPDFWSMPWVAESMLDEGPSPSAIVPKPDQTPLSQSSHKQSSPDLSTGLMQVEFVPPSSQPLTLGSALCAWRHSSSSRQTPESFPGTARTASSTLSHFPHHLSLSFLPTDENCSAFLSTINMKDIMDDISSDEDPLLETLGLEVHRGTNFVDDDSFAHLIL